MERTGTDKLQQILEIVSQHASEEYEKLIWENKDWDILYHLSAMRGNIIEGLPITKDMKVLEVGSECGALSGMLASKAEHVDSLEVDADKCAINKIRNVSRENLQIIEGSLAAINRLPQQTYDMIILVHVLEFADLYCDKEQCNPEDELPIQLLKQASSHLAVDGHLVIIANNRMGLRYWAGATEEHSAEVFGGFQSEYATRTERSYSKPEIEKIINGAGCAIEQWYYPYPNDEFTSSIYSDARLPLIGECNKNHNNWKYEYAQMFPEDEMYDILIQQGMFPYFSNSFMVITTRGK